MVEPYFYHSIIHNKIDIDFFSIVIFVALDFINKSYIKTVHVLHNALSVTTNLILRENNTNLMIPHT